MWRIWQVLWSGYIFAMKWLQSCSENQVCVHICHHVGYNGKCTSVAPIAPEIKFMFIWHHVGYIASALEWLQSFSRNQVYVHLCHYVGYMASAQEWLKTCSKKQVYVHIWHHSSGNQVCVHIWHYVGLWQVLRSGSEVAPDLLWICSEKQVYVHIWNHRIWEIFHRHCYIEYVSWGAQNCNKLCNTHSGINELNHYVRIKLQQQYYDTVSCKSSCTKCRHRLRNNYDEMEARNIWKSPHGHVYMLTFESTKKNN